MSGGKRTYTVYWINVDERKPPHGIPIWLWNPAWIEEDFNPTGIREGHYIDGEGFISCGWDPCQDVFTTDEKSIPLKWARKVQP